MYTHTHTHIHTHTTILKVFRNFDFRRVGETGGGASCRPYTISIPKDSSQSHLYNIRNVMIRRSTSTSIYFIYIICIIRWRSDRCAGVLDDDDPSSLSTARARRINWTAPNSTGSAATSRPRSTPEGPSCRRAPPPVALLWTREKPSVNTSGRDITIIYTI
jgi:hypothetical protein